MVNNDSTCINFLNLLPWTGTNETSTTLSRYEYHHMHLPRALPMAQPSVLYTYSGIGKQRCVWFAGSGFVWSSIGLIHTLYKMKTYE